MKILIGIVMLLSISLHAARTQEERKALFNKATAELKASGIEDKILKVGDQFPDIEIAGKKIKTWLKSGKLIITFYRGGWCPYCVKQLKEMNEALSKIKSNATIIAISPEQEKEVLKTKKKNDITFPLVSDAKNTIARKLNLVFKVDSEVLIEYKGFGIDLEVSQGNNDNELPIPATFVINQDQKIAFAFVDADYTKRAPLEVILAAIKK